MENIRKREKTRALLKDALIGLCDGRNYYDISVKDICDAAGTYRSTFYRYYDSKDEMLREIELQYISDIRSLTDSLAHFSKEASPEQQENYLSALIADMEYHMKNEKICRFLLSPAGDLAFHQQMIDSISNIARNTFRSHGHMSTPHTEYLIHFFASGFVSTVHNWLEKKDRSAEQIAQFLLDMMMRLDPIG